MPEEQPTNIVQRIRRIKLTTEVVLKTLLSVALVVLLALMFPRAEVPEFEHKIGGIWTQSDMFAPFAFPIRRDPKEYEQELEMAKANVYPVFSRDESVAERELDQLDKFFVHLENAVKAHRQIHAATSSEHDSLRFAQLAEQLGVKLRENEWDLLMGLSAAQLREMGKATRMSLDQYLRQGILDIGKKTLPQGEIALRKGTVEEILPAAGFFDQHETVAQLEADLISFYKRDNDTADIAHKITVAHLIPNVHYDESATQSAMEAAIASVPRTSGVVEEGERIVGKNDRITPAIKQKLDALRAERIERGADRTGPLPFFGTLLHVAIVVLLFGIYLYLFRKRIFWNNRRLALIAILILLEGFFAYLSRTININAPVEYLIFVPAVSMLLTIIFDSRVGFYGTVIIAFIVAGIRGSDYAVAFASLVAGALSVYTVRDVRNRSQIIRSLGFIFLGYATAIVALGLQRAEPWLVIVNELTFALTNSIVSPVLTFGLLIFFERYFKVTTDLTFIELGQFNHPLLKLLSERAPGTYHHSVSMASLAEAAAAAVGANEVLARIGALFHDIGKIEKPTYFVENQKGKRSRHDKLAPRMSSLILQNHVKKGIVVGRQYGLPEEVIDFIPQHHGTTRIDYFYYKAVKLAENSDDETKIDEIKEQDYRYPGPKPQTKETGILMLADSIEAAARTLDDPSPQKLEVLIDDLIKKRFGEGELDESPLTLKDLTKIKTAFLGVLVGVYHGRVKYPEDQRQDESKRVEIEEEQLRMDRSRRSMQHEQQRQEQLSQGPNVEKQEHAPREEQQSNTNGSNGAAL